MKVIKRDGRAVDYDRNKIKAAIQKANNEVKDNEKILDNDVNKIIQYIEKLGKKRILVEDIQDIIEERLMTLKKFELAKKYIVYRYNRALVRKQNTTDETILGLIRNENKDFPYGEISEELLVSTQRDCIAGEVSRDLTKRILLPEKISKAHEEGILHFHDANYFIQPIFNSSYINIADMLDKGTVINNIKVETPKTFQVACNISTQIIATVASNQYGVHTIDIGYLGKYLRKSKEKLKEEIKKSEKNNENEIEKEVNEKILNEVDLGIKTLLYQINTLITSKGTAPNVIIYLNLNEQDKYAKENEIIMEELLNQYYRGLKNEQGEYTTPKVPKLIYVLNENNTLNGGEYDYLTKIAIKCTIKGKNIAFLSAKKMKEQYKGNVFAPLEDGNFLPLYKNEKGEYIFTGRFNQGIVTINLPQIAIISKGNEKTFWEILRERLELCYEALMCRHYALLGNYADVSPILWKHGAIGRLQKGEKIDQFLKNGYSSLALGYLGIYETTKLITGETNINKKGYEFCSKLIKFLKETIEDWRKETGIGFVLFGINKQKIGQRFLDIDREKYGIIEKITDKKNYTSSYYVSENEDINIYEKLLFESKCQSISASEGGSFVNFEEINENDYENFIKFIYENIIYLEGK